MRWRVPNPVRAGRRASARRLHIIAALALGLAACREAPRATPREVILDPSSYANVAAFVGRHLTLDLTPHFDTRVIDGIAEWSVDRRDAAATDLVLDTRDLTIDRVEAAIGQGAWVPTPFRLDPATPEFGSALHVTVPPGADRVRVAYRTSPQARGLQWLTPAQTAGRTDPFLFTQAQAIQARSFVPIQDLPGVRVTFEATIHTPQALVAVMAAEQTGGARGDGRFTFRMPRPIPSYLLAFAVGDLAFQQTGPRTGVWAEPSMLGAAAREFADTEAMVEATERLYGPYLWGRYDLLVLPPSFPFGGMENPTLTFATPTVIAGDKSLVALVAHELAHSWSGNLTTNATWRDFWLNEGFTTYIERRIVEAVYGKPRAEMEAMIGVRELEEGRRTLDVPGDRTLLPDLTGRDPDDAYSTVPYEQGALFLRFLEAKFGRETLDAFLRRWFDTHQFTSVTTDEFLAFLDANLLTPHPGLVTQAQVQEWLRSETIPSFAALPVSDAFVKVEQARDEWLQSERIDDLAARAARWSPQEWIHFIDALPRTLDRTRMGALDQRFHLTESHNAEIAHVWFRLAIATHYATAYPAMERYMTTIGRRKLVVPLYRDLAATPDGLARAKRVFAAARDGYHPMTQGAVEKEIKK